VIAIGLSHLPWNEGIFSTADISVGIDVLSEAVEGGSHPPERVSSTRVLPSEVEFVSAMASHSCAFRFRGAESLVHISNIIAQGRASLEAAIAAGVFLVASCISFSFFVLFSACAPSTTIPFVPAVGAVLYLQIVLPSIGMTMAMNNGNAEAMKRVPEKNDQSVIFSRNEGWQMYQMIFLKAIPPALLPQLLHFIAFGELVLHFDPDLVSSGCPGATSWVDVVRCDALKDYSGVARTSSGVLVLAEFVFCTIIASAAFVQRFNSSWEHPPWRGNRAWVWAVVSITTLTCTYAGLGVEKGTGGALPWYWYLLAVTMPWICLVWNESLKPAEAKPVRRSEKLRRLQFETRLGAWSPK
jgi:magnesium-transporting ATPase (P-type)